MRVNLQSCCGRRPPHSWLRCAFPGAAPSARAHPLRPMRRRADASSYSAPAGAPRVTTLGLQMISTELVFLKQRCSCTVSIPPRYAVDDAILR